MPSRQRPALLSLRIAAWRSRRLLVVLALVCASWVVIRQLAPPPPATDAVVVAAREVTAGTVLAADDLRIVRVPSRLVPDGAVADADAVTGRGAAVPLPRGLPVVEGVLTGARFALEPPDGTVVVPVSLAAAATRGMLAPGDLVDLIVPTPAGGYGELLGGPDGQQRPEVLARGALVVDVGRAAEETGLTGLGSGPEPVPGTLVAVNPEEGRRLAAAAASGPLGAVLVG